MNTLDEAMARLLVARCRVNVNLPDAWRTEEIARLERLVLTARSSLQMHEDALFDALIERVAQMTESRHAPTERGGRR